MKRSAPMQRKGAIRSSPRKMKRGPVSGSYRPSSDQQRWHDWLRTQGCAVCGQPDPEIHHCVGSAGKHDGVWIGQDFVLPLCTHHHTGVAGMHANLAQCCQDAGLPEQRRKVIEKALFFRLVAHYQRHGHATKPVSDEAMVAIEGYTR